MSTGLKMQFPMGQTVNAAATNGFGPGEVSACRFGLRDTLATTVVRELSFAEFRAALEKSGKRAS